MLTGWCIGRTTNPGNIGSGGVSGVRLSNSNWNMTYQYLRLVAMAVSGSLTDVEAGRCNGGPGGCAITNLAPYDSYLREVGKDWPPFGHTMVGRRRLQNIEDAITDVVFNSVPGDFAELGVWRGGSCIVAKAVLNALGQHDRNVLVFDAFERISNYGHMTEFLAVNESTVRHNFEKYGVLDDHVIFYKGMFKDTVPGYRANFSDSRLAVLRVDGNFYDSYQDALYYLYDLVSVGGYIIFDDILTHPPVMQAWKDFKADQKIPEDIVHIDLDSAYIKKVKDVRVDMKKMKPPRDANLNG